MEVIWYIIEIIKVGWKAILIMGAIAIPLIWILHGKGKKEWESLDKYYNSSEKDKKQ